jgi:hypothetical protein
MTFFIRFPSRDFHVRTSDQYDRDSTASQDQRELLAYSGHDNLRGRFVLFLAE